MTLPSLKDFSYVGFALLGGFAVLLGPRHEDLTHFSLWPDALKFVAFVSGVAALAFAFGYALAWSRREDREDREA